MLFDCYNSGFVIMLLGGCFMADLMGILISFISMLIDFSALRAPGLPSLRAL